MLSREATSETYGPRVYLHHINLPTLSYFLCFLLCIFITKIPKNIILSYLSDLTLVSDREGITTPYHVGCEDLFVLCRCEGLVRGLLLD